MNYHKEINNVSEWVMQYVKVAGAKGIVVGLSGGIDSSVIACLAVQAVGRGNVIGVSLPCHTRDDMKSDALKLAKNLGIDLREINLEKAFDAMIEGLIEVDNLTQANVKARLRMTALYGISNQINYLVAGTGNLSELKVGYFTKYGDGGVDFEPIGNYYKTEVYRMAEEMPQIPPAVKEKAPSADLWEGQTDEDELGMTYHDLDTILKALVSVYSSDLDVLNIDDIEKVKQMILAAQHKNKVPPRYQRI